MAFFFYFERGGCMEVTEIKAGDILFVWGTSFIETAIEDITHGPSHCALFLDSETLIEAQGGRLSGKVPLSEYLNTNDKLEVWRDPTLTDEERKIMVDYALTQEGIHYDYLAVLGEFLRFELNLPLKHWKEGDSRICSSFVCGIASNSVHHKWTSVHLPAPYDVWADGFLQRIGGLSSARTAIVY